MVILTGDAIAQLRTLDAGSVQTCVTSPPYWGLRDYGVKGQIGLEKTPAEYVARMVEVFREVRRVLKDDGSLWLNLGDSYAASSGPNTSRKNTGQQRVLSNHGYNLTSQRPPNGLKPKNLIGIPWRVAFALQADGWILRSDIIWAKPNPMPESVRDRPTKSHEYLFLLAKSQKYYYDADAIREPNTAGSLRRHRGQPETPNAAIRMTDSYGAAAHHGNLNINGIWNSGRNKRTVWTVTPQPFRGAHFATFPPKLIEPCILAGSREGDAVLDPFAGAGTTPITAERLGRRGIGIELNREYVKMAKARAA